MKPTVQGLQQSLPGLQVSVQVCDARIEELHKAIEEVGKRPSQPSGPDHAALTADYEHKLREGQKALQDCLDGAARNWKSPLEAV